ncbi:hypothetical protein DMENIID0001_110820 [Sergentomyia squamirostris]
MVFVCVDVVARTLARVSSPRLGFRETATIAGKYRRCGNAFAASRAGSAEERSHRNPVQSVPSIRARCLDTVKTNRSCIECGAAVNQFVARPRASWTCF